MLNKKPQWDNDPSGRIKGDLPKGEGQKSELSPVNPCVPRQGKQRSGVRTGLLKVMVLGDVNLYCEVYVIISSMFQSEINKSAGGILPLKICWEDRCCIVLGTLPNGRQSLKEQSGEKMHLYGSRVSICSARKQISLKGMIFLLYSSSNYIYKLGGRVVTQEYDHTEHFSLISLCTGKLMGTEDLFADTSHMCQHACTYVCDVFI